MNQLLSQLILAGGLWTVIGTVVVALLYRSKTKAEVKNLENQAAKIADETLTHRLGVLKAELFDSLGVSEERRRVMAKMDVALNVMKYRIERHARWDEQMGEAVNNLVRELREKNITLDSQVDIQPPPPLNFDGIDFDFRLHRSSPEIIEEIAKNKGIENERI